MAHRVYMDGRLLRIALSGPVSREDLAGVVSEVRAVERTLELAPDRIVDLTGAASFDIGSNDLSHYAWKRTAEPPRNRYTIAFVASSDVGYGISRMYQSLGEHASITVMRVASVDEALRSLAGDAA
jgi:hypothetical protein